MLLRIAITVTLIYVGCISAEEISAIIINYYAVVIDAGSTGSRSFVLNITMQPNVAYSRHLTSITREKVRPGLSSFSDRPLDAVEYIAPLLVDAATVIPEQYHSSTQVFIKGTAGMRLLDANKQKDIWDAIYHGLNSKETIPFRIEYDNLGTINGHQEAYYAVLSSNYIEGSINGDLRYTMIKFYIFHN